MSEESNTGSRRQFLQNALAGGLAATGFAAMADQAEAGQRKNAQQDYEGVRTFAQLQRYDQQLNHESAEQWRSMIASEGDQERKTMYEERLKAAETAVEAAGKLGNYDVILPEKVNTLLHRRSPKPDGSLTEVALARELAEATGNSELADAIHNNITSTHFSGRLTEQQIEALDLSRDFGNPTLYQLKLVNRETGAEGTVNVGLENFHEVGMALENLNRLGHGQNIVGQREYNRANRSAQDR